MIALRAVLAAGAIFAAAFCSVTAVAQDGRPDHTGHTAAVVVPDAGDEDGTLPATDHSMHAIDGDMDMSGSSEIGNAPPPPIPLDHPADELFPIDRMQAARDDLAHMGQYNTAAIRLDILEYRVVDGADGYAWSGELWTGDDYDRLVIASRGEGVFGEVPEHAELHAKWRHTIGPYFNMELGVRQDFHPDPDRTYALIGVEGHTPYWIELEAQMFLSNQGDVHARLEASHDWRFTQKLVLQPDVEMNVALQDVPELKIGSGIERLEIGARLRYEFAPELAPYVGVHWEQKLGRTADLARLGWEDTSAFAAVFGIRTWF